MKFTVVLAPEDGKLTAICPALPGCVSEGGNLDEALANIREAILLCLDVRREDGLPLPEETPEIIADEIEACLQERLEAGLPLTIETHEVNVEAGVAV
jgi:predicted RNase H-like HicB family nuclease